jgi:hypothetical protein
LVIQCRVIELLIGDQGRQKEHLRPDSCLGIEVIDLVVASDGPDETLGGLGEVEGQVGAERRHMPPGQGD